MIYQSCDYDFLHCLWNVNIFYMAITHEDQYIQLNAIHVVYTWHFVCFRSFIFFYNIVFLVPFLSEISSDLGTLRPTFYLNMTCPYIRFYSKIIISINLAFSSRKKISSEICLQAKCTISSHDEQKTTFSIEISSLTQYRYVSVFESLYWSLLCCKST